MTGPFPSAAMNLVIHCLPGPPSRKAGAVANVASVLAPDGVLFGATVLGEAGPHSWLARRVLHAFNRQGGFDNLDDSETAIRAMLGASFRQVQSRSSASSPYSKRETRSGRLPRLVGMVDDVA